MERDGRLTSVNAHPIYAPSKDHYTYFLLIREREKEKAHEYLTNVLNKQPDNVCSLSHSTSTKVFVYLVLKETQLIHYVGIYRSGSQASCPHVVIDAFNLETIIIHVHPCFVFMANDCPRLAIRVRSTKV